MKKALALVLAMAMALSFAACGGTPASSGAASGSAASSSGAESAASAVATGTSMTNGLYPGTATPDQVSVNLASEPPDMNSITTTDATAITVMRHVLEGLTTLDAENTPVPGMAETWDISEDGTVYTFHLRSDAVWSNGTPVTAADFEYAWTQLFTPSTGAAYAGTWAPYIKGAVELLNVNAGPDGEAGTDDDVEATAEQIAAAQDALGVVAVDDTTLEVTLTQPCEYFLSLCTFPNFYPINQEYYESVGGVDGYALDADVMLYNGPYVISEWQHEDHLTISKNADYWDTANKAFIPTINFAMIAEQSTALNSFQAGELDMIGLLGDQKQLLEAEGCTPGQYEDGAVGYLEFNTVSGSTPALANAKVRTAMTLAIDVESLCRDVLQNSFQVADGFTTHAVNEGEYADQRGNLLDRTMSDEEIKALFEEGCKEAGVDPSTITIDYVSDEGESAYQTAAFIQNQWAEKLGIQMEVRQMTFQSRLDAQINKDFDVVFALWSPDYNDALTYLDMWLSTSGNNHTGWGSAEYDGLISQAFAEADTQAHRDLLVQAETLLMEEMPIGPIYFRTRDYICSDKLTGVVRNTFQDMTLTYATIAE